MAVDVIIHIGPPKTGTSAIQLSLSKNRDMLAGMGIYYPDHSTDVNGISSGNVNSIYTEQDDKGTICPLKVSKLLSFCENSNLHTLLLSSEYFFEKLEQLLEYFPHATFVAYIRSPLDLLESNYNQSVKRHHNVEPIKKFVNLPKFHLSKLQSLVKDYGKDRFIFRAYSSSAFSGSSIIKDFYSVIGISAPLESDNSCVNPSYSFDALEFKRWINLFCSHGLAVRVDRVLQAYRSSLMSFSLIEPNQYEYYRAQACQFVEQFNSECAIEGYDGLLADISLKKQKRFEEQVLCMERFTKVAEYLHEKDPDLYKSICHALYLSSYRSCYTSQYGQQFIKKYKLDEVSGGTMFYTRIILLISKFLKKIQLAKELPISTPAPNDLDRLKAKLRLSSDLSDADILRELALLAEKNHDIGFAYQLMKRAKVLRPQGPLINKKIKYYERKIDNANNKNRS